MCNGNITETKHAFIRKFDDCIIIIKNVPALVCSQCSKYIR